MKDKVTESNQRFSEIQGRSLVEATEDLRRLVAEEGEMEIPTRKDRENAFLDDLDDEVPPLTPPS